MSSHGFHRFTQILMVRCSPTEFTEFTEFGSVGMAGMPYPPTSVLICAICGRLFSVRSFCAFRAFCGNIFSPTDFTDLHRYLGCAVLPQNLAAWVWQGCHTLLHLWTSVSSVGGFSQQEVLCVPCVLRVYLFSHGFRRSTQMLGCAEFNHGLKRMFSHGIHRIWQRGHSCHLWEALLCKRFCVFCGIICPPTDFTDLHRWSVCAELNHGLSGLNGWQCANLTTSTSHHLNTYLISPHHHLTTTTSFYHLNTLSLRTQPSAGLPNTAGMTSSPPAAR